MRISLATASTQALLDVSECILIKWILNSYAWRLSDWLRVSPTDPTRQKRSSYAHFHNAIANPIYLYCPREHKESLELLCVPYALLEANWVMMACLIAYQQYQSLRLLLTISVTMPREINESLSVNT